MAKPLLTDELWERIEPFIPPEPPKPKGGRPPVRHRAALTGILFVLKTGIAWEDFPQEMGCCGMTLWNRLHEWQQAGVWAKLHRVLLEHLQEADLIDWSRAVVDSASVRAVGGARKPARILQIAANAARSITSSPRPKALRWQPWSAARIARMSRN